MALHEIIRAGGRGGRHIVCRQRARHRAIEAACRRRIGAVETDEASPQPVKPRQSASIAIRLSRRSLPIVLVLKLSRSRHPHSRAQEKEVTWKQRLVQRANIKRFPGSVH
jgi:hypothetical protein